VQVKGGIVSRYRPLVYHCFFDGSGLTVSQRQLCPSVQMALKLRDKKVIEFRAHIILRHKQITAKIIHSNFLFIYLFSIINTSTVNPKHLF